MQLEEALEAAAEARRRRAGTAAGVREPGFRAEGEDDDDDGDLAAAAGADSDDEGAGAGAGGKGRDAALRPYGRLSQAQVEALRYRGEDVARGITKAVIKEARAKELKNELLTRWVGVWSEGGVGSGFLHGAVACLGITTVSYASCVRAHAIAVPALVPL